MYTLKTIKPSDLNHGDKILLPGPVIGTIESIEEHLTSISITIEESDHLHWLYKFNDIQILISL